MAAGTGQTIFEEPISGFTLTIDRDPQLNNRHRRRSRLDKLVSDAGVENYFGRKVKAQILDLIFPNLTLQQHSDLEQFFFDVCCESDKKFILDSVPLSAEFFPFGGQPVAFGQPLPDGSILTMGRRYRVMDRVRNTYRFVLGSYDNTDTLEKHTTVTFSLFRELDP